MFFVPSTNLIVYREDDGEDQYGDPVTTKTAVNAKVPAHIYQKTVTAADPTSGRILTTRVLKAVISGAVDIRENDVLVSADGNNYTVTTVDNFYNPFDKAHSELTLKRVS